jgi:hypothetical protein
MSDNQESAFPSTFKSLGPEEAQVHRWGMTLRDYFAAKAMQAFIADGAAPDVSKETISLMAYAMADAMLEAREA